MRKRSFVYLIVLLFIIALLLLGIGVFIVPQRVVKIQRVECFSKYGECQKELAEKLESVKGQPFFAAKRNIADILINETSVSKFSTQFKLPSTLKVDLLIKKVRFSIYDPQSGKYAQVTKGGEIVAILESTSLPRVVKEGKLKNVGDKVSEEDFFALQIIDSLFYLYQIETGEVKDGGFRVPFPDGFSVIFPLSGDKERTLGALRFVLSGLNEHSKDSRIKNVSVIDLRFKNPVVR